jgi:hypothetical protein
MRPVLQPADGERLMAYPNNAPCRNRTYNLVIKSHLLCQLS